MGNRGRPVSACASQARRLLDNGPFSGRGSFPGVLAGIVSNRGRPVNALSLPGILLMDKGAVADRDC